MAISILIYLKVSLYFGVVIPILEQPSNINEKDLSTIAGLSLHCNEFFPVAHRLPIGTIAGQYEKAGICGTPF